MTQHDLAERARAFAIEKHGDQQYSTGPYAMHLGAVVAVLLDFGYNSPVWIAAGWLHDVVEDTPVTEQNLLNEFNDEVANLVYAVSGFGHNRKARNACIYEKITEYPRAAILKLADRIANVEASVNNPSKGSMYVKEHEEFSNVVRAHVPTNMFRRYEMAVDAVRQQ